MRSIDLSNYDVTVTIGTPEGPVDETRPYEVRKSLIALLYGHEGLSAVDILDRDDFARKIRDNDGQTLRLDEPDYDKLVAALKAFKGYTRNDAELVRRVLKAQ